MNGAGFKKKSLEVARLGILFSIAIALAAAEQALPALPLLPPGAKVGISHIVVMYCLFFLGKKQAILLAALKAVFVLTTRGPLAASLSFSGAALSLAALMLLLFLFPKISCVAASVTGAVLHNVGQLAVYSMIARVNMLAFYLPFLILSGVAAGTLTGALLYKTSPFINKFYGGGG